MKNIRVFYLEFSFFFGGNIFSIFEWACFHNLKTTSWTTKGTTTESNSLKRTEGEVSAQSSIDRDFNNFFW